MINRREFLKMAATLATAFGLQGLPGPVAAALKKIDPKAVPKLIYLQGLSCTGCSISLLQADSPSPLSLITDYSQLAFHADLSAISGKKSLELIDAYISGKAGDYFLAVEGAIPEKMPEACMIGDKPFATYLTEAAKTMSGALAIGACACDGGIPGSEGNVTGAIGLKEFYALQGIEKPVINIRGCSVHPDWVWHTVIHLVKIGMPELVDGAAVYRQSPEQFADEIRQLVKAGAAFVGGCCGSSPEFIRAVTARLRSA